MQRWNLKAALAGLVARNFKAASKIASVKFRRKAKFKERLTSLRRAGRGARRFCRLEFCGLNFKGVKF
ncbi:MAG: hypothetical protein D8H92_10060 [Campylobacter sp.]|nr:MAG: hypothetical protein D8H92_10060 [Campylobacter sp.]